MSCPQPSWTPEDLAALEAAISAGATKVKYRDREVTYSSLSDLLRLRGIIRAALCGHQPDAFARGLSVGRYHSGL